HSYFFFSSRRRHTRFDCDWSSDVCSSDLCVSSSANSDAYVARLTNPTLSTTGTPNNVSLTYFSYLGGSGTENGSAIGVLNASTRSEERRVGKGCRYRMWSDQ